MLTDQRLLTLGMQLPEYVASQLRICKSEVAELKTEKYKVECTINEKESGKRMQYLVYHGIMHRFATKLGGLPILMLTDWQVFANLMQNNIADIYIQMLVKPYGTNPMHDIPQFY